MAIFDTDILYSTRLMEYFRKSAWEGFEILLFTKEESLREFLDYQGLEILLYGGVDLIELVEKSNIKYVFYLCDDKRLITDNNQYIYKYQSASKITSDLLSLYTKLEDIKGETSYGDVRLVSVFPPLLGPEKISFAWSLAKEVSKKMKVLFIPLEMLPTSEIDQEDVRGQSLSEFLYYLKESKTDPIEKMKSYLNYSERLSYLSGLTHGFDLLSICKDDIGRFIRGLKEHKDYEMIIIYLGIYTEASMEILKSSDKVCILTCDGDYEENIRMEWERQMEFLECSIKDLKHHFVKLPSKSRKIEIDSSSQIARDIAGLI